MTRLCIFARAPVLGKVKTRLAGQIGAAAALAAHEELVCHTLDRLASVPELECQLWIAGAADHPGVLRWARRWALPVLVQRGDDLGARMCHAIETSLAEASAAVIVGTDCPGITADYVRQAAFALQENDLVLGPAEDGGYGLIGLRRSVPECFENVAWGTDLVLAQTIALARERGLSYRLLDEVWDVDDERGWARYRSAVRPAGRSWQ